jgi:hypothetical protein
MVGMRLSQQEQLRGCHGAGEIYAGRHIRGLRRKASVGWYWHLTAAELQAGGTKRSRLICHAATTRRARMITQAPWSMRSEADRTW